MRADIPVTFLTLLYVGVTGTVLVISLGNKPNGVASQWFFKLASFFYAILVLWVMAGEFQLQKQRSHSPAIDTP